MGIVRAGVVRSGDDGSVLAAERGDVSASSAFGRGLSTDFAGSVLDAGAGIVDFSGRTGSAETADFADTESPVVGIDTSFHTESLAKRKNAISSTKPMPAAMDR